MRKFNLLFQLTLLFGITFIAACTTVQNAVDESPTEIAESLLIETETPQPTEDIPPTATPNSTATAAVLQYVATVNAQRSPDVPPLPFDDNPDPLQCGIPTTWTADSQAWLNGTYEGELVRPTVFLYDSHLRLNIEAQAVHGSEVEVLLFQQNPVTDYYLVKIVGADQPNEGWVPAPFLSFDPVES